MDLSNAVTVTVYAEAMLPLASAVDIVTVQNYITLSLSVGQNFPIQWANVILTAFVTGLYSFCAIFLASGIIARRNHSFTDAQRQATETFMDDEQKRNREFAKEERWHKIADTFCVSMENVIINYFDTGNEEQRKALGINFSAYLNSFMLFIQDNNFLSETNLKKINIECANLFDFIDQDMSEEERFFEIHASVAEIRYLLTQ